MREVGLAPTEHFAGDLKDPPRVLFTIVANPPARDGLSFGRTSSEAEGLMERYEGVYPGSEEKAWPFEGESERQWVRRLEGKP